MGHCRSLPATGQSTLASSARYADVAVQSGAQPTLRPQNERAGRITAPDLPEDLLGQTASFRPIRAVRSMALDAKSWGAHGAVRMLEAAYSPVRQAAEQAHDLASFQSVLGSDTRAGDCDAPNIGRLRQDLKARALTVLLRRIPELPATDRQAAAVAFRKVARTLGADHRTHELMAIERIARCNCAAVAAAKGENLRLVAAYFGMIKPGLVSALERYTARRPLIRAAVQRGANVQVMAERNGFVTGHGIRELERIAILGPAGDAVRGGRHPRAVAQRYGLTSEHTLLDMALIAIDSLPLGGEWSRLDRRQVAANIGVDMPGPMALLASRSAYGAAAE